MAFLRMRWVWFAMAAVVLPLLLIASEAYGEKVADLPKPTGYVSDFAGVLSPDATAQLDALCAEVDQQAHAQIAVVTVKTLDGESIEEFATALEDKWKVGSKATDKGVLLLLAVNDHKYRIEVGYGLEGILPDGKTGDIGRSMVPDLKSGDYDAAVGNAVQQLSNVIAADAGVTLQPIRMERREQQPSGGFPVRLIIPIVIFLLFLFFSGRSGGGGMMWFLLGNLLGGGFGGGGRRGGGFGGGGDGGGFGGFGGGSSGGGGASGDW